MSSTTDRNTPERVPKLRTLVAAAGIHAGVLGAVNADNKAVPASDTAGLTVLGRSEHRAKAGEKASFKAGCFAFDMPDGVVPTLADIGKTVFVVDDHTVAFGGTSNAVKAGVVFDVDSDGVWVLVGYQNYIAGGELPDLSGSYLEVPSPAAATADLALASVTGEPGSETYSAGDGSANLIADLLAIKSKVNAALGVLRSNGFITTT